MSYKVGDRFRVIKESLPWVYEWKVGDVLTLENDDGSRNPGFRREGDDCTLWFPLSCVEKITITATFDKYRFKAVRSDIDYVRILRENPDYNILSVQIDGQLEPVYLVRYKKFLQFAFDINFKTNGYGIITPDSKWHNRIDELIDVIEKEANKEWVTVLPIE